MSIRLGLLNLNLRLRAQQYLNNNFLLAKKPRSLGSLAGWATRHVEKRRIIQEFTAKLNLCQTDPCFRGRPDNFFSFLGSFYHGRTSVKYPPWVAYKLINKNNRVENKKVELPQR